MIYLTNTTDKLQITTSAALNLDVQANYIDASTSTLAPSGVGRQLTAISTATTTDVLAAPGASTVRTLKQMTARNKDASSNQDVTVIYNANGTSFEIHKTTLTPGDCLQYIEGVGFFTLRATVNNRVLASANTADVTASAADTYLSGSGMATLTNVQSGTVVRLRGTMTKTAAGVAAPVFTLRCGAAGSTADTSLGTFTGVAQTAATDTGWFDCEVIFRTVGASSTGVATLWLHHKNTTTGFANAAQVQILQISFSALDLTTSKILGISCNPGASGVWTFQNVTAEVINPKPA